MVPSPTLKGVPKGYNVVKSAKKTTFLSEKCRNVVFFNYNSFF